MKPSFCFPSVLMATLSLALVACGQPETPDNTETLLRPVKTLIISATNQNPWRELPGIVDASRKADLNFRISGKLESMLVSEGDLVTRGQLLARLDATDLDIQLRSRKAEYQQIHADYERSKALVDKGVISRSDFNKLQAQNVTAKSNLSAAQQNVNYTRLTAPFDGRIALRYVDNFEEVSPSQPIYSLQDPNSLAIKMAVPQSMIIRAREEPPILTAEFEALPNERFPLTKSEISTQADPTTKTFEVTFSMPDVNGHNILPGMSVTVRGQRAPGADSKASAVMSIPAQAVLEDTEGRFVFVVTPGEEGRGTVQRQPVTTGELSGLGLQVLSGLKVGDQIVIAGMSKMRSGLEVLVRPEYQQ